MGGKGLQICKRMLVELTPIKKYASYIQFPDKKRALFICLLIFSKIPPLHLDIFLFFLSYLLFGIDILDWETIRIKSKTL